VRQLESRGQQLVGAAQLLSDDVARHRPRIATVLMRVSPKGTVAADTLQPARLGAAFPLSPLLDEAEGAGAASRSGTISGAGWSGPGCWPAPCGSRVPPDHFPENGGPRRAPFGHRFTGPILAKRTLTVRSGMLFLSRYRICP
jgi:hypothetical protein